MLKRSCAFIICLMMLCAAVVPAGAIDLSQYVFQCGGVNIPNLPDMK